MTLQRPTLMWFAFCACCLLATLIPAAPAWAGGTAVARDEPDWPGVSHPPLQVAHQPAPGLQAWLQALLQGLAKTPPLDDPRGVSVHPSLTLDRHPELALMRAQARLRLLPLRSHDPETRLIASQGRYQGGGEGPALEITVNDPEASLRMSPQRPQAHQPAPELLGQLQGWPRMRVGGGPPLLVMALEPRPLWLPISLGEHLSALAEGRGATAERAAIALAALDEGRLSDPACLARRGNALWSDCEAAEDATPLVRFNPDYFDMKRPDAAQLVVVRLAHQRLPQSLEHWRAAAPRDAVSQLAAALDAFEWSALRGRPELNRRG